jgi:hypothetical protein
MLPGLGGDDRQSPPLVVAVRRTFAALDAEGLLGDRHAAVMAMALFLADSLATSVRGRGASLALLARELRETLALLPEPVANDDDDAWSDFEANFRAAAMGDTPQP